jgi:hypothetical protein
MVLANRKVFKVSAMLGGRYELRELRATSSVQRAMNTTFFKLIVYPSLGRSRTETLLTESFTAGSVREIKRSCLSEVKSLKRCTCITCA